MALNFTEDRNDTIAAIATGLQESGIGIIRISGPDAIQTAASLYRNRRMEKSLESYAAGTIHFGYIVEAKEDGSEEVIDEVMVSVMKAPKSYTTEDTVEINTHGGIYLMQRVLGMVLSAGCRLAEPGEFTKRAFLGGRIDLVKAEAVMDLIQSQNERARKAGMAGLGGRLSERIRAMREKILYETAYIESALDDPENYSLDGYEERLLPVVEGLLKEAKELVRTSEEGRLIRDGIRTVIIGKPNVGKSTLLNMLSGQERAIVTQIPGTTRDVLEEKVRLGSLVLCLSDTAGIRSTEDEIERMGIERSIASLADADLIFFLLDQTSGIEEEDLNIAEHVKKRVEEGSFCILLANKDDLIGEESQAGAKMLLTMQKYLAESGSPERIRCIRSAVKKGFGIDEIRGITEGFVGSGKLSPENEGMLGNRRQAEEMKKAEHSLSLVLSGLENGVSEEFLTIDLMNAYTELGRILGESVEDDLVEEIFSRFCMGK